MTIVVVLSLLCITRFHFDEQERTVKDAITSSSVETASENPFAFRLSSA